MSSGQEISVGLRDLLLQSPEAAKLAAPDSAVAACRNLSSIAQLRQLRSQTIGRSEVDGGCGWVYQAPIQPSYNPATSYGAFGALSGPLRQSDKVPSGARWFWNMEEAEKKITTDICSNINRCSVLKTLGQYDSVCGFCRTTRKVIPIQVTGNQVQARYPNDSGLMCQPGDIVRQSSGACPAREGFVARTEISDDALEQCQQLPLSRDCVILAARMSGCSDNGTLIQALGMSPAGQDYDSILHDKPAFQAYQSAANPGITSAILQDGSASLGTAMNDFGVLMQNMSSTNPKVQGSATELCKGVQEGYQVRARAYGSEGFQAYNFCTEITAATVITNTNLKCLQDNWKNEGGTEQGTGYATLNRFVGRTYQAYLDYTNTLFQNIKSSDKATNANAILEFMGVDSRQAMPGLPRDNNTRGAETVWIDFNTSSTPIILRCDLRLATDGEVLPFFGDKSEMVRKYNVPGDTIALTSAYELRFDNDTQVQFQGRTDDGFMIGVNQNPFENTAFKGNDWGSWRVQAPTTYESGNYSMTADSKGRTNTIVTKWFQNFGGAVWQMKMKLGTGSWMATTDSYDARKDIYLTQEPLAPWMQYEVCSRPNSGTTRTELLEKRWNGEAVINKVPSFDVRSSSVTTQTDQASRVGVPGGKGYISFTTSSSWQTLSQFSFTAFKTITLLVRPNGILANGATPRSIFHHINFTNLFGTGLYLKRANNKYYFSHWVGSQTTDIEVTVGEWNVVVLQYIGDENNLRNVSCHVATLKSLQSDSARRTFLDSMKAKQGGTGSTLYGSAVTDRRNAGFLILGGTHSNYKDSAGKQSWTSQSFEGDVAWIHGFRTYLDTDALLRTEINQQWKSRWPRGNIDGEAAGLSCSFNATDYANYYSDIRAAFGNDNARIQKHWDEFGIRENRTPCGNIDPTCKWNATTYLNLHPDVKNNSFYGTRALEHYKRFGITEGRAICPPK